VDPIAEQASIETQLDHVNTARDKYQAKGVPYLDLSCELKPHSPGSKPTDISIIQSLLDEEGEDDDDDAADDPGMSDAEALEQYFEDRRKEEAVIAAREHARLSLHQPLAVKACADLGRFDTADTQLDFHQQRDIQETVKGPTIDNDDFGMYYDPFEGDPFQPFNVSEYFDFEMLDRNAE
jgi:hypothetical protein